MSFGAVTPRPLTAGHQLSADMSYSHTPDRPAANRLVPDTASIATSAWLPSISQSSPVPTSASHHLTEGIVPHTLLSTLSAVVTTSLHWFPPEVSFFTGR